MMGNYILMMSAQNKTKTSYGNRKATALSGESQHPTQLLSGS